LYSRAAPKPIVAIMAIAARNETSGVKNARGSGSIVPLGEFAGHIVT